MKKALIWAALVVVVIILIVVVGSAASPSEKFHGGAPSPAASAEEAALRMLSWRDDFSGAGREPPSTCYNAASCAAYSAPPSPEAHAEEAALRQLSWRPEGEKFSGRREGFGVGACALFPHPAAIAEAGGLQSAGGLSGGAPYFREGFLSGGAMDEAMTSSLAHRNLAAANQFKSARESMKPEAPYRQSARQARHDSVRESFGGPGPGFGWSPSSADRAAGSEGGWGDAQSACAAHCRDNCNGAHCESHCSDVCVTAAASGAV